MARTGNPMDRLITLMSSAVSAGAEDAMRLATSLREGRIDLDEVQRWYEQRRDQSMDLMKQIGDELQDLRQEGVGRFVTRGARRFDRRVSGQARSAARSRRRRRASRGTHRSTARHRTRRRAKARR